MTGIEPQPWDYKFYTLHSQPQRIPDEARIHEEEILSWYWFLKTSRFHCICPIKNLKTCLPTLIFKQITPNLENSICTPWNIYPPNLSSIDVIVFEL